MHTIYIYIAIQFISTIIAMQCNLQFPHFHVKQTAIWTCAYKNDSKEKCETMIKLTIPEVG